MTKRLLVSSVCLAMATSLMAAPMLAQAQAPAAAPATPAPATPAPATPAPATPASAAPAAGASAPAGSAAATPAPAAKPHAHASRGQRIEQLQTALNANGAQLTVDGKSGPKTTAAVSDFQKAHGLKVTGHADKETWAALKKPA